MNNHTKLFLIVSLTALFSGCAGRNHTLFMTKSNVGLDFDGKPPTLEITVSRKEAVIAPTFEGGQTPPVAASFKPRAGAGGGFANFFLGVDQTFQGGDAAVAMASLYASPDAPSPATITNYNSALPLSTAPRYTGIFRGVPGAGESRTFIFGTDTSLGLKVAWSGAGGQFPDTVRLGFNRKEFAWAPIFGATHNAPDGSTNAVYSVKMPSFLATIDSDIETGNRSGGISALQYFASGETATLLALQPAVREAMIKRLDPKAAGYEDSFVKDESGECLRGYWKPDGTHVNTNNATALKAWMSTNNVPSPSITMLLRGAKTKTLREKAIKDLNINCDQ
jgi:hypothetical protein